MKKYLYQRFLPNCDTNDICLEESELSKEEKGTKILISVLDNQIDTEEDLREYLTQYSRDEILIIVNDRPCYENPILQDYANKTLRSYLHWIRQFGYRCWQKSED